MRLMIVGSDQINSIENYYVKYLSEAGVNVSLFTAQKYFYEYYSNSIFNKLLYKSSFSSIIPKINQLFKFEVEKFNPDIIWIFKGMEITPSSLLWAKEKNIKLVNYNPDNPFIFSGKGSGNENVTKSIGLYDIHFTYNLDVKERLEREYQVDTSFLPFGFDLDEELFYECTRQDEVVKLCFIGNPDSGRVQLIEELASAGVEIDVYGHNWKRFTRNPKIKLFPAVYGSEFWKTLYRYRIQLNLMRPHNENSHNMRSFEVPGAGGIMLAPDTREHRMFYEDGKELFLFSGAEVATSISREILGLSTFEANQIRQKARSASIERKYSYRDRANDSLMTLLQIGNKS